MVARIDKQHFLLWLVHRKKVQQIGRSRGKRASQHHIIGREVTVQFGNALLRLKWSKDVIKLCDR